MTTTKLIDEMLFNLEMNRIVCAHQKSRAAAILRQVLDLAWSDSHNDEAREQRPETAQRDERLEPRLSGFAERSCQVVRAGGKR